MTITVGGTNITLNSGSVLQDPPGSAPSYLCRAWVNFNGTGTVAIRASGNVSSITDNGTGDYTANFTTAMSDANYAESISAGNSAGLFSGYYPAFTKTSSALRLRTASIGSQSLTDLEWISVLIFR